MHNREELQQLDLKLLNEILVDIKNGILLKEADDETLDLVLTGIWQMREMYHNAGIVTGDA